MVGRGLEWGVQTSPTSLAEGPRPTHRDIHGVPRPDDLAGRRQRVVGPSFVPEARR